MNPKIMESASCGEFKKLHEAIESKYKISEASWEACLLIKDYIKAAYYETEMQAIAGLVLNARGLAESNPLPTEPITRDKE